MKFKTRFYIPEPDFKSASSKELWVEMPDPDRLLNVDEIEYKVCIPDFMFNELANSEPKFKTEYDVNSHEVSGCFSKRSITSKFQKTQTAITIKQLKDYISGLTDYLLDKYSIETTSMQKKIFIRFAHSNQRARTSWLFAYLGQVNNQSFQYFIGYETISESYLDGARIGLPFGGEKMKVKKYVTNFKLGRMGDTGTPLHEVKEYLPLTEHNENYKHIEARYSIIDWTQEREDFCKRIQDTFKEINQKLADFLQDISNEKIDHMIANNFKLLSSPENKSDEK